MGKGKLNGKRLSGAAAALSEFRIPVTRRGKKTARPVTVGLLKNRAERPGAGLSAADKKLETTNIRAQRVQARVDVLVAAVNLLHVFDGAFTLGR